VVCTGCLMMLSLSSNTQHICTKAQVLEKMTLRSKTNPSAFLDAVDRLVGLIIDCKSAALTSFPSVDECMQEGDILHCTLPFSRWRRVPAHLPGEQDCILWTRWRAVPLPTSSQDSRCNCGTAHAAKDDLHETQGAARISWDCS
jgi:hypothetical protein